MQEMTLADRESHWPLLALTISAKRSMFVSWQGSENFSANGFSEKFQKQICTHSRNATFNLQK